VRWVALIAIAASVAGASPQVRIHAHTQLSLQRVKKLEDGRVEVIGQLVDRLTGDAVPNARV